MVKTMAKSSVIVDLAAPTGGNCEATVPGEMVEKYGVTIIGPMDLARTMPVHASQMYSKNITAFTANLMKNGELAIDLEDQIIRESMLTNGGVITNDAARQLVEAGER
jgi:NAD(P) transhydrogenase subunit alpha